MTTQFTADCAAILNAIMPRAEARASLKGRVLAAVERSEIARLVRESLRGSKEALETLQLFTGTPALPARPAAPAITEATDLGAALLEAAGHRSPFFAGTARTVKAIAEDASIPGATPGVADEIGRMALVNGDERFHQLTQSWAMKIPFGGTRLDGQQPD
jgi:hypothetical protein